MKIVTPQQMSQMEAAAYSKGRSELNDMEKAGQGVAEIVRGWLRKYQKGKRVLLLCSKGHNGGDAYVAGRYLKEWGYEVSAFNTHSMEECKPLTQKNRARFVAAQGVEIEAPSFDHFDLILDGLFGTGFKGKVEGKMALLIQAANHSRVPIAAIDIPSGLDGETGEVQETAIRAAFTLFLGLPKKGFFFNEGWNHTGSLYGVDFGLPLSLFEGLKTDYEMLTKEMCKPLLPPLVRNRHKYQAGYVVGIAGSPGMSGAALLSSFATLKAGAGITRLFYPKGMEQELLNAPYEILKSVYEPSHIEEIDQQMARAAAVFMGPGLGRKESTLSFLRSILERIQKPCVIDADALNLISMASLSIPKNAILTPHYGEMLRLLGLEGTATLPKGEALSVLCKQFVEEHRVTLILKGGPTFVFHPGQSIFVNPYGDPGMATAGTGDVLTGVVAGLLAQGLSPEEAAKVGVVLHGLAGEKAAEVYTSYGMTASDLLEAIPEGFKRLLSIF